MILPRISNLNRSMLNMLHYNVHLKAYVLVIFVALEKFQYQLIINLELFCMHIDVDQCTYFLFFFPAFNSILLL